MLDLQSPNALCLATLANVPTRLGTYKCYRGGSRTPRLTKA